MLEDRSFTSVSFRSQSHRQRSLATVYTPALGGNLRSGLFPSSQESWIRRPTDSSMQVEHSYAYKLYYLVLLYHFSNGTSYWWSTLLA